MVEQQLTWLQALVLAFLQGATEFIPVSSSAHLVIFSKLLGDGCPLAFAVTVHLGTLLAVLVYYRRSLKEFFAALFVREAQVEGPAGEKTGARRFFWLLMLATIPAGVLGVFLSDVVDRLFSAPLPAAAGLLVTAVFLWLADRATGDRRPDGMSWWDAVVVGLGQALAIMPGISRSGTTIFAAVRRKLSPGWAPRFSFLLSIPVIAGAGLMEAKDLAESPLAADQVPLYLVGGLVAAAVGYLSIYLVVDAVRRGSLFKRFGIYCIVLALATFIASGLGVFK